MHRALALVMLLCAALAAQGSDDHLAPFAEKLRQYEAREKADPTLRTSSICR